MELSAGVRPTVPCYVRRAHRKNYYGRAATCSECKTALLAARPQLITCSPACRQRRRRRLLKEAQELKAEQEVNRKAAAAFNQAKRKKAGNKKPASHPLPEEEAMVAKKPVAGKKRGRGKAT